MTFSISLGMIVRNEERTLRQCLESVAPFVDEIVIGLGGESTDNTETIAREFTDKIFQIEWTNDFSEARNKILEKVTGDYFLWIDGDDVLLNAVRLPQLVRENPNVDGFYMGYDYARDENENTVCYLIRERLVRLQDELPNRGWTWLGQVHEVLVSQGFQERAMMVEDVVVQHHKPPFKHEADRNLKILYKQLEDSEPNPDPRILAYLCTENAGRGNYREAILHGQRFVKVSGWLEERYQMQHRIADLYRALGDAEKALKADFDAITLLSSWPDAYFGLAMTYAALNNYPAVVELTKIGAAKPKPKTMLIINPLDYTYYPILVLAGAYAQLGDMEMALANYETAYSIKKDDTVASQIVLIRQELELQTVTKSFLTLREHLGRNDEWLKVRKLFDCLPKKIEQHPLIQEAWGRTSFQTGHVVNPQIMIDFYRDNPHWQAIPESRLNDPDWLNYPRTKFAIDTAKRIGATTIVDWGCSDGFIALPLSRALGIRVTGFDLDPRCVDLATRRTTEWETNTRFEVGNVEEIGGWDGEKADLALLFEVIEHVVDPSITLAKLELTAKHIAITTPHLSWEMGNLPEWDRLEPKGHLRIFDQYDLERIISPRGKIYNLYRQPWNYQGWLFCDYAVGEKYDKTITIGAMGSPEAWNPRKFVSEGLGGSETAVIKLSEAFFGQNHKVVVYSNIDEPGYYNGVCYRDATHYRSEIPSDLYIAWRAPEQADWNINTKRLVLWMHDTDVGDRLTPDRAYKFNAIVVLTEWHKKFMLEKYPFLKPEKFVVIGNGVDLSRFSNEKKIKRNPKRVVYSSSPDRGLDIILENIWPKVIEAVPDAELHIYYGWVNFDKFMLSYPHLREFKDKIERLLLTSKNVVNHGRVNQDQLAEDFLKSSIWLYPTYFTETYCITAIEAQLAGVIPVTNHLAALSETVASGIILSPDVRDPSAQEEYAKAVITILLTDMKHRFQLHKKVKQHAPANGWDLVANLWRSHFLKEN